MNNVENYRGISILSCLPKVLERLIYDAVYPSIHNIISPRQHGFVHKRSTTTNLLTFVSSLIDAMANLDQTDAIYNDFQ